VGSARASLDATTTIRRQVYRLAETFQWNSVGILRLAKGAVAKTTKLEKNQDGLAAPSQFQVFVHGVLAKYLSIATWIAAGLVLTPLLLRHLGSETYGLYAALGSVGAYLSVLDLGTGLAIPKYVAEYRTQGDLERLRKLSSSFFIGFIGVGAALLVGALAFLPLVPHIFKASPSLSRVAQIVFLVTVANFLILLPFGVLEGVLYGFRKVHINYWLDALFYIFNLTAAYVAVTLGYGLVAVTVGTLGARILVSLVLARLTWTECPMVRLRLKDFDWEILKKLIGPSFYYFVIQIAALLIFSTDNVLISFFLGVSAVTSYSIAFRLCRLPLGLISSLAGILLPHISELDAVKDLGRLRRLHIQITKYSVLISLIVFTCLFAFGKDFIDFWVGPGNFAGMPILICFCLVFPVNTVVQCSSMVLMGTAQHKRLAGMLMFEGFLNIAFSILLLHHFGALGVALGTLLAKLAVSFWFAPWYACRLLKQNFWEYAKGVWPALLPLLPAMVLAVLGGELALPPVAKILGGSLAIAITFGAFFYCFSIEREERAYLRKRVSTLVPWRSVVA
jgi:O-antigen/teichoic acid export membrane protein